MNNPYTHRSGRLVPLPEMERPEPIEFYFGGIGFQSASYCEAVKKYEAHLASLQSQSLEVSPDLKKGLVEGKEYVEGVDFKKDIVFTHDAAKQINDFWGGKKLTKLIAVPIAEKPEPAQPVSAERVPEGIKQMGKSIVQILSAEVDKYLASIGIKLTVEQGVGLQEAISKKVYPKTPSKQ